MKLKDTDPVDLPEFTWCVSPNMTVNEEQRLRVAQFGDGYEQRAPDGINTKLRTFSVSLTRKTNDIFDIINFLRDRGSLEEFIWTIPDEEEIVLVRCTRWSRTLINNATTINATFKEIVGMLPPVDIPDIDNYPEYKRGRRQIDIITNIMLPHIIIPDIEDWRTTYWLQRLEIDKITNRLMPHIDKKMVGILDGDE